MVALGLVELKGVDDTVEHAVRDAAGTAPLEAGVVLDADTRQERDLLTAKTGHATVGAPVDWQAGLLGGDLGPAGGQELPEVVAAGDVWLDPIASPRDAGQRMTVAKVRFAPGARTAWHSHALGQTLHITQGVAWVQSRGSEKVTAYPGQTIYCPPGEEHWHGAAPDAFMEHLAMLDNADDPATTTTWLEHVGDDEYNAAQ